MMKHYEADSDNRGQYLGNWRGVGAKIVILLVIHKKQ